MGGRAVTRLWWAWCALALAALVLAPRAGATAAAHATEIGRAPGSQPLDLVLPLTANLPGLERFATAVTTPGSPEYGDYESIAELARRFGAPPDTRRRVLAYLRGVGASGVGIDATGLFADATVSARLAERLFGTRLSQFGMAHAARYIAPTAGVRVPAALHGLVTGVVGLDTRPVAASPVAFRRGPQAHAAADGQASSAAGLSGTPSGCAPALGVQGFTPAQYQTAYNYVPLYAGGLTGGGERVALIEIDGFKSGDIETFAQCFGLRLPRINAFGVGVKKKLAAGAESTLDLEVLDAAAPGLRAIDVYETHPDAAHTLRALTAPLQHRGYKPEVISASLGLCEPFTYEAVHRSGLITTEGALAEAAASGITFLASSGDSGSADCVFGQIPIDRLAVNYPASSPWVTGVGGTNLILTPANSIQDQPVWNDAGLVPGSAGGGGTSALFLRPSYQKGTVAGKLRAVPDVSMLADVAPGYDVFCSVRGECINSHNSNPWQTVGGTSAGTPLLAGGFALVDQDLRLHQRQDLGLVNPLLYGLGRNPALAAQAFSDVTHIGNDVGPFIPGNGHPLGCCAALPGFDQASGWGSVNLAGFAALALSAQPPVVEVGLTLPGHQSPVRAHHVLATVSCSGPCLLGAAAALALGGSERFNAQSKLYRLKRAGRRTIAIPFSDRQLGKLRSALAHHERIVATVVGAVVDPSGNVERESLPVTLRIRH
jgi:kumamolisin